MPQAATAALPETCSNDAFIVDAGTRALYIGPSFTLGAHRNAVAVLAFGLDGEFSLQRDGQPPSLQRVALIPPGQWQTLDARGGTMGFLYLDADDKGWRALLARAASPTTGASGIDADAALTALEALRRDPLRLHERWSALVRALDFPPTAPLSASVAAAMAEVRRTPGDPHPVALHARRCGCAVSTFQRWFTAQAGMPWRRWRQWQRLRHAAQAVCAGRPLTDAAHAAGFASGAHFSDAFKATFGMPPMRLLEWKVRWRSVDDDALSR